MRNQEIPTIHHCDCLLVGGGLAGLCTAIQLARAGHRVVLVEKQRYPFHKVCGEYISLESWDFLCRLGVPLERMQVPIIKKLKVSAPHGKLLTATLPLGGFGISRYTLDAQLADIARQAGVTLLEQTKVVAVTSAGTEKLVTTSQYPIIAKIVLGAYGKLKPHFVNFQNLLQENYIGVKYHIKLVNGDADTIALHNFAGGYCGLSKIEDNKYCLCYLSTQQNLTQSGNVIKHLEERILYKNPYLEKLFTTATFLYERPLVISQIGFQAKATVVEDMFLLGDAAGAIAPLAGNGMSMAMRASTLLAPLITNYLTKKIDLGTAKTQYAAAWKQQFGNRIKAGYYLQQLMGKPQLTTAALGALSHTPTLLQWLIRQTHGQPF